MYKEKLPNRDFFTLKFLHGKDIYVEISLKSLEIPGLKGIEITRNEFESETKKKR